MECTDADFFIVKYQKEIKKTCGDILFRIDFFLTQTYNMNYKIKIYPPKYVKNVTVRSASKGFFKRAFTAIRLF